MVDVFGRVNWSRDERDEGRFLPKILSVVSVLVLLGMGWGFTLWAGGSSKVTLNWFYIPIMVAAALLGPAGALVTAILATIIAGPLTPADVHGHIWEPPSLWIVRGVFYMGIGLFVALVIDSRRRTEHQLEAAKASYRSLIEQMPGVVYLCEFGGDGDWLYVSPSLEGLLGVTPEEWLEHPHPFRSHVHPQDHLWVLQQEVLSRTASEPLDVQYRMRTRDGRWIYVRDTASVVRDVDGSPLWMQGVLADVTAQTDALRQRRGAA